ncbi:MAG: ROK family protein [Spirochaetaceae bacterium]|nr:ROK family protein [Spirochaetaceae bacterium]
MPDSKQFQRIVNRSHVLQKFRVNDGISRIEVSRQLGLDRSTITNLVNPLLDLSIVKIVSEGDAPSRGGRRPVLLGINENFGSILGIDLQINTYNAVLINLKGDVLKEWSGALFFTDLIKTINDLFLSFKDEIDAILIPLIGIGVGIPGVVDTERGYIIKAKSIFSNDLDFFEASKGIFSVPILIDNDANCCAWGQLEKNKNKKLKNFLNIIWKLHRKVGEQAPEEIEIGIGIVINGEVYYGSGFSAGELPEYLISRESGDIYSYNKGKWEFDQNALELYLHKLFEYLIPLFHVFDPGEIFFGGQFVYCKEQIETILENSEYRIFFPEGNDLDTAYGAASMFMEKLFQAPVLCSDQDVTDLQWNDIFSLITR